MPGITITDKDGHKHEVLLPQGEHLLEYVRNAERALRKEELFDHMVEALELLLSSYPVEHLYPKETHGTILFRWSDVEQARELLAEALTESQPQSL